MYCIIGTGREYRLYLLMEWKDFLYYQRGSKIAVILLLILIVLTLIFNAVIVHRNSSEIVLEQNDSIICEFKAFSETLKEREPMSVEHHFKNSSADSSSKSDKLIGNRSKSSNSKDDSSLINFSENSTSNNNFNTEKQANITKYYLPNKLLPGETILLNDTDTANWKMIPGIGSIYSSRIVKYRNLLGGFVRKEQLMEVYGIDNELFSGIAPYIEEDTIYRKLMVNKLEFGELLRHPYLNYKQVQAIFSLRNRKGKIISITQLAMLDEFTSEDIYRLEPYLEF